MGLGIGIVPTLILYVLFCIWVVLTFMIWDPDTSCTAFLFRVTVPKLLTKIAHRILGPKAVRVIHTLSEYILAIIYLIIVLGSWSVMFAYGYPFITKSNHVSNVHKYMGYIVFGLCMYSWKKAHKTSPGYITDINLIRFDNYPYDDLLFVRNKICPTVGIQKLARSKYDRYTNRHVPRFDHFCGWIHNTVGEENYRYFLVFLLVHIAMCVYGTIVVYYLFMGEIDDKNLWNATFFNTVNGQEVAADAFIVMHFIFMKHFPLAMVFVLMAAMAVTLSLFFTFHFYLIVNGMTTNEYYKWKQVKKWHKRATAKYRKSITTSDSTNNTNTNDHVRNRDESLNIDTDSDVGCIGPISTTTTTDDSTKNIPTTNTENKHIKNDESESIFDPGPLPRNIYNLGFLENLKEVIYPRSLRRDALQRYHNYRSNLSLQNSIVKDSVVSPVDSISLQTTDFRKTKIV